MSFLQRYAPNVLASVSAWHVADEVEIFAVGRHRRMSECRQSVGCNLKFYRGTPFCVGARRCVYLHRCRSVELASRFGEIHCLCVGRECNDAFVKFRVEFALNRLRTFPFAFLVLFGEKHVGILHSRDFTFLVAGSFFGSRCVINLVAVSSEIHRAEVGAARVEKIGLFNHIARPAGAYLLGRAASLRAVDGKGVVGAEFKIFVIRPQSGGIFAVGM